MSYMSTAFRKCTAVLATVALAATFTVAPSAIGSSLSPDIAHAKDNGKGGGRDKDRGDRGNKGGGKDKDRGNKGGHKGAGKDKDRGHKAGGKGKKDKADRGFGKKLTEFLNPGQAKKAKAAAKAQKPKKAASAQKTRGAPKPKANPRKTAHPGDMLHNSQLGRWNAKPAQAAIDAHIRNGNFNGTVGLLAQYDLALRAQNDPHSLSDDDLAALDALGIELKDPDLSDTAFEEFLASDDAGLPADAEFTVKTALDGTRSAVCANCTSITDADGNPYSGAEIAAFEKAALEATETYEKDQYAEENAPALDGFLKDAEGDIIDNSNKDPAGIEADLLDGIADFLGEERPEEISDFPGTDSETAELDTSVAQ